MVQQSDNHYRTSDTALSAFLITKHHFLVSIDYLQPRFEYLFTDSDELRKDANDYVIGNALTDPATFVRIFRKLNRIIRKQVQWEDD